MTDYIPNPLLNLAPRRRRDDGRGGGDGGGKPPRKLTARQVVAKMPRDQLRDIVWTRLFEMAEDLGHAGMESDEIATLLFSVGAGVAGKRRTGGWDTSKARPLANAVLTAFEVTGDPPSQVKRK